jgi:hypothetical protein
MAARTKKTDADATEKAAPKKRAPKPVTDLPSATVALKAAQRRAERADKAYDAARTERDAAQAALEDAKATVKRFYAELVGESVDAEPEPDTADDGTYPEPADEYEGAGHNAE